jgi:hypothetical protein
MVDKKIKLLFISLIAVIGITFLSWSGIMIFADSDKDGIVDSKDNCPYDGNFDQIDSDSDTLGDTCDTDDDNDGVNDEIDSFDLDPSEWSDFDADSIGDNKDTDDDNDGVSDSLDQFDTDPRDWADFDFDGIGSSIDTDDDNDGILDTEDTIPILSSENLATKYLQDIRTCADMGDGTLRLLCYSQFFGRVVENEENNSDAIELSIALSKIGTIDDCHFVSHEIGHVAFEETKDVTKSLHDMDGTMCRGGYFHGVLASYFHEVEESGNSFPDSYQTVCDDLIGSSNYQDCIHGLGHGLVHYFGDDLHSAVDKCNDLSFYQDILCTKGVMMQYTDDVLTRQGISQNSLSNLCIESELDKLDYQECSMSLGTTIAFFTNHNFDEGKISCGLIGNEKTQKLCLEGLRFEIEDSERYEVTPLTLEKREKYQPQFVDDKTIDIRTPAIISNFSYSKDIETILFSIDREGYVIMYVPFDLLPNGEAILTVNGQVPANLASDDAAIRDHVAITFEVDSAGMVYLGPK